MNKVLSKEEIEALFSTMVPEGARICGSPDQSAPARTGRRNAGDLDIEWILDTELPLSISFHNSKMQLEELLKLRAGSVIKLNDSIHDPVTIVVNHKPVARGEFVTVNGNYGVRILEVDSAADRIRSLR
jgi:flagellar motor switch protein FliN/FliY